MNTPRKITISQIVEIHNSVQSYSLIALMNCIRTISLFSTPGNLHALAVVILRDGELSLSINGKIYTVNVENNLLLTLPGTTIQLLDVTKFTGYILLISPEFIRELPIEITPRYLRFTCKDKYLLFSCPQKFIEDMTPYRVLFHSIVQSSISETHTSLKGLVESYLYFVLALADLFKVESILDVCDNKKAFIFERFLSILSKHYVSERQVSFYAEKLDISPQHFSLVIKDYSGKSPLDWINDFVISESIVLLQTGLTIQQVAYKLKFTTQSSFGKYFKLQTGFSPKAYLSSITDNN